MAVSHINLELSLSQFCVGCILRMLPKNKASYKMSSVTFGRTVMGISQGSKDTLSRREIIKFSKLLLEVFKKWDIERYGWSVEESGGIHFTVVFRRLNA